jgi:calcineurin-like phosphoesterase family protein
VAVYFTSDTHFGDPRALRFDHRPFSDLEAHDAGLIARWNGVVAAGDTVRHLGDVALGLPPERVAAIVGALHGEKHLIVGNNDGPATLALTAWASVQAYKELTLDDTMLVLCHYAFRTWNGMGRGSIDLHGHSHGALRPQARQYDVGVDVWDFTPVTLAQIRARRRRTSAHEGS